MLKNTILLFLPFLASCAALPVAGDSEGQVLARFGAPTATIQDGIGKTLEFATGPFGQQTWMAHLGPDGRLLMLEQVLKAEKFGTLQLNHSTKLDVLRAFGRPTETSFLSLSQLEVWSYRYKEHEVWNSMMHLHFDQSGVLRLMQNGPDPMYEERRFFR